MSYVRIDYKNGCYEYLENNIPCGLDMRANELLRKSYKYIRMKKMEKLPPDKECNKLYYTKKYKERIKEE
jgi:hypothetical protein